jgi:hypothetical protein
MKKQLTILLLLIGSVAFGQGSLITVNGWNAYVALPASYSANPTKVYPTIVFFPGLGEVGTVAANLYKQGPSAYVKQLGNTTLGGTEFIVISLQPPAAYPAESLVQTRLNTLKSSYRIDPKRLYLTGLSMGGWTSTTFVTGDAYGGPYNYASQIAAVVDVEGVIPDDINAFGKGAAEFNSGGDVNAFGNFAGLSNTHSYVNLFGKSASADDANQTVFGTGSGYNVRLAYNTISGNRKLTIQDASGTIAYLQDIIDSIEAHTRNFYPGVGLYLPNDSTIAAKIVNGTDTGVVTPAMKIDWDSKGYTTNTSVATANGFAGTVATAATTPDITISTTVNGIMVGNGTSAAAAVSGTDIKTINGTSLLGSGNITVSGSGQTFKQTLATSALRLF